MGFFSSFQFMIMKNTKRFSLFPHIGLSLWIFHIFSDCYSALLFFLNSDSRLCSLISSNSLLFQFGSFLFLNWSHHFSRSMSLHPWSFRTHYECHQSTSTAQTSANYQRWIFGSKREEGLHQYVACLLSRMAFSPFYLWCFQGYLVI